MTTKGKRGKIRQFWHFFSHYAWLGLVLIIVATAIKNDTAITNTYVKVANEVMMTCGIAILVSAAFSFAADSASSMERVRGLLSEVVISKEFLRNIDENSKRDALKILMSAASTERKLYANIESYYDYQIDRALKISQNAIRSHYNLRAHAKYNLEANVITISHHITYRLFPSVRGFEDIKFNFSDVSQEVKPKCRYIIASSPCGKRKIHRPDTLDERISGNQRMLYTEFKIASEFSKETSPHLDIEISVDEIANGNYYPVSFQTLLPTDGFNFKLFCDLPLKIKTVEQYSTGDGIQINEKTENELAASHNQWMNEGSGIMVIVEAST